METRAVMNRTITAELERERKVWLVLNPGIVGQVAAMTGVTSAMVYMVLKGRRRSPRVEAALAAAGAPGFERVAELHARGVRKESSHGKSQRKTGSKKTSLTATR